MRAVTNLHAQYWWWHYMTRQLYSVFCNVRNWLTGIGISKA